MATLVASQKALKFSPMLPGFTHATWVRIWADLLGVSKKFRGTPPSRIFHCFAALCSSLAFLLFMYYSSTSLWGTTLFYVMWIDIFR